MADQERKRSPVAIVLAVVGGTIALLGCGGALLFFLVIFGLASLGNSLSSTFEEVARDVEAGQP